MNPFRHLLLAAGSHPPIGTWLVSGSPLIAEALGHVGFDWALIDMEHAPVDLMNVVHLLQALSATRTVPVVRVPWNEPVMVKRVVDAGAQTVMFPFVQSAEEARAAVAATRYPPAGSRGMSVMTRAARFGTQPNYLKTANEQMGVVVQIETVAALGALENIAAVGGVDAVFLGPGDLSASMGHVGQPGHAEVVDAMGTAVRRCKALGKPVGTIGATPEQVAQYRAMGFDFVALSGDVSLLVRGAQAALGALRTQEVGAHVHVHTLSGGTQPEGEGT